MKLTRDFLFSMFYSIFICVGVILAWVIGRYTLALEIQQIKVFCACQPNMNFDNDKINITGEIFNYSKIGLPNLITSTATTIK